MKHLACSDMGMKCSFVAEGWTKGGVKRKMMDHGMTTHKQMMEKMSDTQMKDMESKMEHMIK